MRRARGFTLIELLIATTVAAVLAAIAMPSFQSQVHKARRTDGIAALMRLEFAQARYRANNGIYTSDLRALGVGSASLDGHYQLAVTASGPNHYSATAEPLPGSAQAGDGACAALRLDVEREQVRRGPSRTCWNR